MNRNELASVMASKTGLTQKETDSCIEALLDVLVERVASGSDTLNLIGWIKVERRTAPARTMRNPATGAMIDVPEKNALKFTAGKKLKDAANA